MKRSTMKVLSLVMALVMIVGALAVIPFSALPGTAAPEEQHVHTKGTLVQTVAPSCGLYGYTVYKCAECGEAFIDDVTEKLEHEPQEVGEIPATCEAEGRKAGIVCANCGIILGGCEAIAKSHTRAYKIYDVDDCAEGVWYVEYCKVCGEILAKVDELKHEAEHELKADIKTAPTCYAEGVADIYCENCGYIIENVPVEKIAHEWEEKKEAATFRYNTRYYNQCKVCGIIDKDAKGNIIYTHEDENTNHAFLMGIGIEAELEALKPGETYTKVDTIDGSTFTYTKPACSHKWVSDGYVFAISEEEVKASKDYADGYEFIAEYATYLDKLDLSEAFVCSKCGETKEEVIIKKVGHVYGDYTFEFKHEVKTAEGNEVVTYINTFKGGYSKVVQKCGALPTKEELCVFCYARDPEAEPVVTPIGTLQEHKYVVLCQDEECKGNKKYEIDDETYYVCTDCTHETRVEICLNVDTENESGFCFCENQESQFTYEHEIAENATIYTKPATCVAKAYKYRVCKNCGAEIKIEDSDFGDVDPSNHDWSITEQTKIITLVAPTCTTAGRRVRYCNRFGCPEFVEEVIAIDPDAHDLHIPDDLQVAESEPATCTKPLTYKYYCDICKKIIWIEEGEPLEATSVDNHANKKVVEAVAVTCTKNGTYSYTYCEDCGIIIEINGEPVIDEKWNVETDLDKIIIPEDPASKLFTEEEWEAAYGDDTNIQYEIIKFANGKVMCYKMTSNGTGHSLVLTPGFEPTCFNAGLKDKLQCEACGLYIAGKDGAQIKPYEHKGTVQEKKVEAADKDLVKGYWALGITDANLQQILAFRAKEIRTNEQNENAKDYYIEYVLPTCTKDGYIIGKYCTRCMALDEDGEPDEYFSNENLAGYKLKTPGKHDYESQNAIVVTVEQPDPAQCGAEYYSYTIRCCARCAEVETFIVADYEAPKYPEGHKAETYEQDTEENKKGDIKYYYFFDEECEDEFDENDFIACTDSKFVAKRCVNCGEFFDVEEIVPEGHYTTKLDGTKEYFDLTCTGYKDYIGLVCEVCGLEVPNVVVEKDERGVDFETYYTYEGEEIDEEDIGENYFEIIHDWAIPQDDCEALNAELKACAACGINVINEDAEEGNRFHRFLLRTGYISDEPFEVDDYEYYAFDDVTYPTTSTEGFGTITCQVCGKTIEVTIPVLDAVASAEFDTEGVVLIGNEVTVTIKVSAKEFSFNELKLYVNSVKDFFELVDVEVLYPFAEVDAVKATIGVEDDYWAYVAVRTPGIANRNVTITGEDVPFLKLTYKVGDLFVEEYTDIDDFYAWSFVDVIRIDDEGNIIANDGDFSFFNPETEEDETYFGEIEVYNPAYTGNVIGVLAQIYSTEYANQYDFNKDGRVDLDDYFAMVDFIDSKKTVADFCALIGYDIEAMLDTLDYATYSSGKAWTLNPNTGVAEATQGTEADIINAKEVIRRAINTTSYEDIEGTTIADFAQSVID